MCWHIRKLVLIKWILTWILLHDPGTCSNCSYTTVRYTAQHMPICAWHRHQMETFSVLLVLCAGTQKRPATQNFDVCFDLRLNKWLIKDSKRQYLRGHRVYYDVTAMWLCWCWWWCVMSSTPLDSRPGIALILKAWITGIRAIVQQFPYEWSNF